MSTTLLSSLAIIGAALVDILANYCIAKSEGFRKKAYGLGSLCLVALAFYLLSIALKGMDLSVAYSAWGALGILGTSAIGALFLGQKLNIYAYIGIPMIIVGITILKMS